MTPEPYIVQLDPDTKTTLKIFLFKDVQNTAVIRKNVMDGVWHCAIIKSGLILDPFQVAVAANKAVLSQQIGTMVTRTVYTEILYNLSLTKNISQSLSKFGIENDNSLLVCFLVREENDISKDILPNIEGELCPISDLDNFSCMKNIKNAYKLNNFKTSESFLDVVVSRMATKSFVQH